MIVGVTGHQEMPAAARAYVVTRLHELLRELPRPVTGLSSLAAGADQLFAEAVLEAGGVLHVIRPARRYELAFDDAEARERYRALLVRAAAVDTLSFEDPSEVAFFEAGKRIAERVDLLVAVWDGEPARGLGGTADVVRYAEEGGTATLVVWPAGVKR